jgi:hypothetical protein
MSDGSSASAADKIEIHELLARYAWSFDTADVDGFVSCFAPDAIMCEDVFEEEDRWVGHDEIRSMAEHFFSMPGFGGRQHHVSQILIEGSNDRCRVRAFIIVIEPRDGEPAPSRSLAITRTSSSRLTAAGCFKSGLCVIGRGRYFVILPDKMARRYRANALRIEHGGEVPMSGKAAGQERRDHAGPTHRCSAGKKSRSRARNCAG